MRAVALALAILSCGTLSLGTGVAHADQSTDADAPIETLLADPGARVLWVGAHPDDEALAGPILARACIGLGRPCKLLVLTHGDGGRCPFPVGCYPDLGSVRHGELSKVARAFGAELEHHRLWNAPLPESSFPKRAVIARRWMEATDPGALVARAIRAFRPTIVLTFEPHRGFTNHPEHQLASRYAMEGVRRAADVADVGAKLGGLGPHRVRATYQILNHYWIMRLVGAADPSEPTEAFDTHAPCGAPRRTCLDVALAVTRFHETQSKDMGTVRALRPQMGWLYLKRVDPVVEPVPGALDP
ncbi:PIG-L family deacetylase [Myxococcota bacterium]|nr:PIG-L family deacetylase [Myxococcota bacterium]